MMLDWLDPLRFLESLLRVGVTWSAFYALGYFARRKFSVSRLLPLVPAEIIGASGFLLVAVILSLFGVLNRTITPILLMISSIPGFFLVLRKFKVISSLRYKSVFTSILFILVLFVTILNLANASMPDLLFDDPLITYAVQPDRWLNNGHIYWLDDTQFSGFPLVYEIISVWPASLSYDRLDQLSVLQVFQVSFLLLALYRGSQLLKMRLYLRLAASLVVLLCTMIYYFGKMAKPDGAALLFCTLALLASYREMKDRSFIPLSSWFLLGLALATKQSALLALIIAIPWGIVRLRVEPIKQILFAVLLLITPSCIFAARTILVTGSPTYPVYYFPSLVKEEWLLSEPPDEIITLNDRDSEVYSSYSTIKNIALFFACMEGIFLLFLFGAAMQLFHRDIYNMLALTPIILYFLVSLVIMWPPWWGAKYSMPIYPFLAILGASFIAKSNKFVKITVAFILCISIIVPGFIIAPTITYPALYRYTVLKSIIMGKWDIDSGYVITTSTPDGMMGMWLNSYLTEPCRVLSLHEEKRYFFTHELFVGWRHPFTQSIYDYNSIYEECAVLEALKFDYVVFYRNDPGFLRVEDRLQILGRIGNDDILCPLAEIDGLVLCRFTPLDSL